MDTKTIVIENYEKLNDKNIINIIKILNKIDHLEEFSLDSEIKKLIVTYRNNFITKEIVLKALESKLQSLK